MSEETGERTADRSAGALDEELLEILVCPKCKGELDYRAEAQELVCSRCRLRFAIRDGIPIMLLDEAKPL